jgi:hypothetical protein
MKAYVLERLKEPSTWRGIIWVLSAFGVYTFSEDQESAIIALSMALAGAGGLLPDHLTQLPFKAVNDDER